VPVARIPFWRLRAHGVVEEAVRGGTRRRLVGRDWTLPEAVHERVRGLLEPLGFDLGRPVSVREPEGEDALEFSQDSREEYAGPMKSIGVLLVIGAVVTAGCASAPTGPSVMVLPGSGKSMEQFQTEDARCRQSAAGELAREKGGQVPVQMRYDMAYMQCMYAQGNQIPMGRPGYSSPAGSAPATTTTISPRPAPPAGTPPPPPASPSR